MGRNCWHINRLVVSWIGRCYLSDCRPDTVGYLGFTLVDCLDYNLGHRYTGCMGLGLFCFVGYLVSVYSVVDTGCYDRRCMYCTADSFVGLVDLGLVDYLIGCYLDCLLRSSLLGYT